jgi:hypothetical protein
MDKLNIDDKVKVIKLSELDERTTNLKLGSIGIVKEIFNLTTCTIDFGQDFLCIEGKNWCMVNGYYLMDVKQLERVI